MTDYVHLCDCSRVSMCKLMVLVLVLVLNVSTSVVECVYVFELSKLVNFGLSDEFAVANESQCAQVCTANVSAVSYSWRTHTCIRSTCGDLKLQNSGFWKTYVCIEAVSACQFLTPLFEWSMTDVCGFANTGSFLNSQLSMTPVIYGSSTSWAFPYMPSPSVLFGNVVLYPNAPQYASRTPNFNMAINMSKSMTLFGYFYLNAQPPSDLGFPLFDFSGVNANGDFSGLTGFYWYWYGGLYYYFDLYGCSSGGCSNANAMYLFQPTLNTWYYTAVVYNAKLSQASVIVNGEIVQQKSGITFNSVYNFNGYLATASRNGLGKLGGSTYCLKLYEAALTLDQVRAVASSCVLGKITLL